MVLQLSLALNDTYIKEILVERFFCWYEGRWSWRLDLNPRPADYKSAALPTELRQLRKEGLYVMKLGRSSLKVSLKV